MDREVLLHIIDGPGAGWTWIALGFLAATTIGFIVRTYQGYDQGVIDGRQTERREGLDQFRAQIAKLSFDQQQIITKLDPPAGE